MDEYQLGSSFDPLITLYMLRYVRDNNNHQNNQPNKLNNNPKKSIIDYRYNNHNHQYNIFNIFKE